MTETGADELPGLIDPAGLRAGLHAAADLHGPSGAGFKQAVVVLLKQTLATSRAEAERRLMADARGTRCAVNLAHVMDEMLRGLFDLATARLFAGNPERIAIVAVGGYGRGTLAPGSDIDLLFLIPAKQTKWCESVIEFMLYALWDTRLKVGHSVRSVEECLRLARSDTTIMTATLEAWFICGDRPLYDELARRFRSEIVTGGARAFIAGKMAERAQRHHKAGSSRYLVEPDVKDGKGGLRDLHTLFWIAKFVHAVNSPEELAEKGAFSREELAVFMAAEDFLWAVRCHLHFIAGRGEDRLSFDRQPEVAERLGYTASGGLRHVEAFMKHYFLMAKDVGDLTRIFCASLEAREMKDARPLRGLIARFNGRARLAHLDFRRDGDRVTTAAADVFERDPVNLIRLFAVADQAGLEIHPDALKRVRASLGLVEKIRGNDDANAMFLKLLSGSNDPGTVLRWMNEADVLGRFIPDFGRIVALMQFNMYHHYTVDEHLIRAVGIVRDIEKGDLQSDHPLSTQIFPTLKSRRALYVAVLLHDIAKGRPEDHSIAGAAVAEALCPRLGMDAAETETVSWLIRHHLLMSETAQMRDLNDYKTILDFAHVVQSPERLKLLLILTVADIRAVGPGVWNGWKGQLLRTLYAEAEPVLTGGHTGISRRERLAAAQGRFFSSYPGWDEARRKAYAARHYDAYWLTVPAAKQLAHEQLMARATAEETAVAVEAATDEFTAITELAIYAPDHPRLLALITGACAASGANIMGAQIFTTADGMALDTILIQREFADAEDERRRAERIAAIIRKALTGEIRRHDLMARMPKDHDRLKAFSVPPRVIIDNEASNKYTLVEVNGLDRIGLLSELTEAISGLNLNIASAHITTYGEKAVDVFYVTDLTGDKLLNPVRHRRIEEKLTAVLTPPEETASAAGL